ncbi:MAG TPA: biotin/lipoate A/B protein ligase family protein [Methylomirabilota bacterium]|nr:biotin/lipoate A/B protein ligase family protein [Methylomirabilota bacterium]
MRVIDAGDVSAVRSQAIWYGVAAGVQTDSSPALTLVNSIEPYVCIGLHQDPEIEVDTDYCRANGIAVLRRRLGGGAVYLDRDQLIFHFIWPRRRAPGRAALLYPRFIEPVLRTYRALGIAAVYRPVNDIQAEGRKIGGTAAAILDEATVLGGMLLFDFDTATMARCLKVPSEKFRDKLTVTLESYVTSMRRLLPAVPSRAAMKALFLRHASECLGVAPQESTLTETEAAAVAAEAALMTDPGWLHRAGRRLVPAGVKVAADMHLTEGAYKAPGGLIRVQLLEHDGHIADIDITGDFTCIPGTGLAGLMQYLRGAALSENALSANLRRAVEDLDLPGVGPEHLAAAIQSCRHREG